MEIGNAGVGLPSQQEVLARFGAAKLALDRQQEVLDRQAAMLGDLKAFMDDRGLMDEFAAFVNELRGKERLEAEELAMAAQAGENGEVVAEAQ